MIMLDKKIRGNDHARAAFNTLAGATFGLNFENWYQNGYWNEKYIPYTMFDGEKAVSNVSVNIMDFETDGGIKHYIQLGTVMTSPEYRHRGLIKQIMKEVDADFADKDGVFLFANDSVLDFYPKFGFKKADEYRYAKAVKGAGECSLSKVPMNSKDDWNKIYKIIENSAANGRFFMRNADLDMFYLSQFMTGNVYCSSRLNAYPVIEFRDREAFISDIFSEKKIDLNDLIDELGAETHRVILNFTPDYTDGFEEEQVHEEDTTLFLKGGIISDLNHEKMMFPELSHA